MAVEVEAGGRGLRRERARPHSHVVALAEAGAALAEADTARDALARIVRAAAAAVGASVAIARVREGDRLVARIVVSDSRAVTALLEGSSVPVDGPGGDGDLSRALDSTAAAVGATSVLAVPAVVNREVLGSVELMRSRPAFSAAERDLAVAVAAHVAAAVRRLDGGAGAGAAATHEAGALELAAEALAAAGGRGAEDEVVHLAVHTTAALESTLWRRADGSEPQPVASHGGSGTLGSSAAARALTRRALDGAAPVRVDRLADAGDDAGIVVTLPLGRPADWALQLLCPAAPPEAELRRLVTFGVRGLHALRAAERARTLELELERTRALLALAAQANEQLSLSHTLGAVLERIAGLVGAEKVAVYLGEGSPLTPADSRKLEGPHTAVAERLLELALGPFRGRGVLVVEDARRDPRLAGLAAELAAAGIEAAVAALLVVPDGVTGLLALYPSRGRTPTANETALIAAMAAQLAVSVQNARLHEQATQLGAELEDVLVLERQAARQLRALYEISRSFAQSLSLETTLEAVVRTVVELLDVDAAVIRMPDARGEVLAPRALHVADARLEEAVRAVLGRGQPLEKLPGRRNFMQDRPLVVDAATAARLGPAHEVLEPFLERGSTAVELPIKKSGELLGTLSLLSLDPARPIDRETIDIGLSVAAQAALAIDNARLYQQQKRFADTMQHSLLPREHPEVPQIELGDVYESSARVEVGGDVYDFLTLGDGRLAVVLGDVTGHGIDAAADMAMAKFVFRSLAREHSEPSEFLAAANEVVCGEISAGKFITMLYLTVDGQSGELACASAGHPAPRLVLPDGEVRPVDARGLALGIDPGQTYAEMRERLPVGAGVVVYTDGVVEARRDGELYGTERLDRVLARNHDLPAEEIAHAVLADCRAYSRGDLADDCALVVIKRTGA